MDKTCAHCDQPRAVSRTGATTYAYCREHLNQIVNEHQKKYSPETRKMWRRNGHLRRSYGLAPGEFERIVEANGGGCQLCGFTPSGEAWEKLHVDHDHTTGDMRGLICNRCNTTLGRLNDDPALARRMADYLER